jgi:D-tyrosyl-tRNA(Tyr) deacylase
MLVVVQRVRAGRVDVDGRTTGAIGRGLVVLVGIHREDAEADAHWLAERVVGLRVFADEAGRMNFSVAQVGGGLLLVPNFTLCATTRKGHRPGFDEAMKPAEAQIMFQHFVHATRAAAPGLPVETGVFGANMTIDLQADGPVTLIVDSKHRPR